MADQETGREVREGIRGVEDEWRGREGSLASRQNMRRIPSSDYGKHFVDVAGMLVPPI